MGRSFLSYGFMERWKLGRALSSVTSRFGNPQASREAMREAVSALEVRVIENPREWVFWYALGDWYSTLGEYAKAVRACEKCYELRPRDARSAYGLATTLRMLARAKYVGHPKVEQIREFIGESGLTGYDDFDPPKSQQGLEELGLTVDQAAEKSLSLFEEVLTLGVNDTEVKMVKDTLAAMYAEFPHLESRVKSSRKPSAGLFAEARGDPFNGAADHYRKIRYVMNEPAKYQAELVEIIRLCQLGIARQRGNGDAYVLLANAYSLAALHALGEGYKYCLSRAAAVIYEWRTTRPPTKNQEIGEQVYRGIVEHLERPLPDWMNLSLKGSMGDMHKEYYRKAIDPNSIAELERILANA